MGRQNKAIEKELRDEKRSKEQRVILLLLGAGESGKSTFAKQMKILFLDGYTEEELSSYRNIIRSNCIMGMRTLLLESQKRELYDGLPKNLKDNSEILTRDRIPLQLPFTPELAKTVNSLWKTDIIQNVFSCRNEYQLSEFVGYFCENAERIAEDAYIPTVRDVLHARARTIGIEEICNCKYFDNTPLIVFLNKSDLLKKKIKEVYIAEHFSDYKGGKNYENAISWLKNRFASLNRNEDKPVYIHATEATDTDNIRYVFSAVEEIILYESLAKNYLL